MAVFTNERIHVGRTWCLIWRDGWITNFFWRDGGIQESPTRPAFKNLLRPIVLMIIFIWSNWFCSICYRFQYVHAIMIIFWQVNGQLSFRWNTGKLTKSLIVNERCCYVPRKRVFFWFSTSVGTDLKIFTIRLYILAGFYQHEYLIAGLAHHWANDIDLRLKVRILC